MAIESIVSPNPFPTSFALDEIECPWCGKINDWTDVSIDSNLVDGYADECTSCGKKIKVTGVDWSPTVYLEGVMDIEETHRRPAKSVPSETPAIEWHERATQLQEVVRSGIALLDERGDLTVLLREWAKKAKVAL